ncbi:unnamed protein product [Caenorhabditis bovis]|uniref:C2H2-type domain-containing protein n=1 Tax=Caenorhabditis bovis TaxID=2654633 RepID=A0A8S1FEW3_9PELO|nr:unnamed protein product [Caenorhabditis bovis]
MANVIGGGMRKPPRIMSKRPNVLQKRHDLRRNEEINKARNQGFDMSHSVIPFNPSTFRPKKLPGLANEVESFPCRCCDRVYLTGAGLAKHAQELHPDQMDIVTQDIHLISNEWKKREFEEMRAREIMTMDKMRHEARANELIRASMNGEYDVPLENELGADRYEACAICNVLVNTANPSAMDHHQKAHKKNDQLRMQLLDQYGAEIVRRLTCESCSLVFTEEGKLQMHIAAHHSRKKRYICKFCGHISASMTELNIHKSDVHNITDEWSVVPNYMRSKRHFRYEDPLAKRIRKIASNASAEEGTSQAVIGTITDGDVPCQINCPDCSLKLNRPVLIIKHMLRCHSKRTFSCVVESGGLPSFGIDVAESQIFWTCCNNRYESRTDFLEHRRMHIPEEQSVRIEEQILPQTVPIQTGADEEPNFEGQLVQAEDGSMQVIIPEGVEINGDMYVMLDQEFEGRLNSKVPLVYAPQHHFQLDQGMIINQQQTVNIQQREGEMMTLTQDHFEQIQMGDDWGNMEIVMLNNDGLGDGMMDEHHHHHQLGLDDKNYHIGDMIVDENEVEIGAEVDADIHGTPLFD